MANLEEQIRDALTVAVAKLGVLIYTEEDLKSARAIFGGDPFVVIERLHTGATSVRVMSKADGQALREERIHKDAGHVRCECGNWIQRERNGWSHVGGTGDDIPLHIPSPA